MLRRRPREDFPLGRGGGQARRGSVQSVPTLLIVEGFRFFFFSNEGTEPPHVHVERGDGHAKYWLEPVELVASTRMKLQELRRVRLLVVEHETEFREKWREHFGT